MTTEVIAARAGASYADLAAMLREHRIGGFPVVDEDGVVVGVVSESDLLARQAARRPHRKRASPAPPTAADLMSWPPVTGSPDETVRRAARLMYARKLRRLPVVDDRTLAGAPGSVILGRNIAEQVRHVEGVIAVRDRFTYPAPASHSACPAPSDPGL